MIYVFILTQLNSQFLRCLLAAAKNPKSEIISLIFISSHSDLQASPTQLTVTASKHIWMSIVFLVFGHTRIRQTEILTCWWRRMKNQRITKGFTIYHDGGLNVQMSCNSSNSCVVPPQMPMSLWRYKKSHGITKSLGFIFWERWIYLCQSIQ